MKFSRLTFVVLYGLSSSFLVGSAGAASEGCTPIKFARGESAADISGIAPADGVLCYSLQTGAGQTASISVVTGNNVIFGVTDLVDAQQQYEFKTERKTYEIRVTQLMRSVTDEPFKIHVSVTGGK